jgi:uncharacterized protein
MITESKAIALLKRHSSSQAAYNKILAHSQAVKKRSLEMAHDLVGVNIQFLSVSALLHDIGRFHYPPPGIESAVRHGVFGADLLRAEGFPDIAQAVERHVGSGITRTEARAFGLPDRSFMPQSVEEKILCLADSLTFGTRRGSIEEVLMRYRKEVGEYLAKRTIRLHTALIRQGATL